MQNAKIPMTTQVGSLLRQRERKEGWGGKCRMHKGQREEQIWQQTDMHAEHLNHLLGSALMYSGAWTCWDAGNYESRGGVGCLRSCLTSGPSGLRHLHSSLGWSTFFWTIGKEWIGSKRPVEKARSQDGSVLGSPMNTDMRSSWSLEEFC